MAIDFEGHKRKRAEQDASDDARQTAKDKRFQRILTELQDAAQQLATKHDVQCRVRPDGVVFERNRDTLRIVVSKDATFEVIENQAVEADNIGEERMMDLVLNWIEISK